MNSYLRTFKIVVTAESIAIALCVVASFSASSTRAQDQAPERPCIRDLKQITQQAAVWPGRSKKTNTRGWMLQKFLKPNSFYEKIGLLVGDIILEVNGIKANPFDPKDPALAELYNLEGHKPNKIMIEREGSPESVIYTCPYN